MIQLLRFISSISLLLYGACALVFLFSIRSWWMAQQEGQRTIYGLEKEVAAERANRAVTLALFAIALAALVYFADANASVAGTVAPPRSPTPNLALFITPTATVPAPTPTSPPPSPTPLRGGIGGPPPSSPNPPAARPTATSPPAPPTPVPQAPFCPDLAARIVSPGTDAYLMGTVPIIGSANIANFQYYKIEYGIGDQPQQWAVLGELHRRPVVDGVLETVNASAFQPGVYRLRLTVVDNTGNFPIAPCSVRVNIGQ